MKVFIIFSLAFAVASGTVVRSGYESFGTQRDSSTDDAGASPSSYVAQDRLQSSGGQVKCEQTYRAVQVDKCEPYVDKVCTTLHTETCVDVKDRNCRGIVNVNEARQCFNVTEQICGLREHISYEVIPAVHTAQNCRKVTDRVCDIVFETEVKSKNSYQCISVANPHCADKDQDVNDKTCRTTTSFDCPESDVKIIRGQSAGYGGGYGCKKSYDTRCYDTPRTISTSYCQNRNEKVCEKITEQVAYPVEKKVCHDEVKRVCELEQRQQPKQVKKYTYYKECRPQVKKVCDNVEVQKLVQNCVPATRKRCSLSPVEKCEDIHQKHCRRITEHVPTQKCEPAQESYGQPAQESYGQPAQESYGQPAQESYGRPAQESYGRPAQQSSYRADEEDSYQIAEEASYQAPRHISVKAAKAGRAYGR